MHSNSRLYENVPSAPKRKGQCAVVFIREGPRTKAIEAVAAGRQAGRVRTPCLPSFPPSLVGRCPMPSRLRRNRLINVARRTGRVTGSCKIWITLNGDEWLVCDDYTLIIGGALTKCRHRQAPAQFHSDFLSGTFLFSFFVNGQSHQKRDSLNRQRGDKLPFPCALAKLMFFFEETGNLCLTSTLCISGSTIIVSSLL